MNLRRTERSWAIIFFIIISCYLKKTTSSASRFSAPIGKQQEYFHAVRKSLNEVNDPTDLKLVPAHWSTGIIKHDHGDEKFPGVDEEPGFDLSDEEITKLKLWPKGVIPYYIDVVSFNDKVLRDSIRLFLNVINSVTRITFLEMPSPPKDEATRWVFFVNRRGQLGCADHSIRNYTNRGVQPVVLGYDCMSTGGELAEAVLSIAGIPPQHNAPDRDDYIKVVDENILPDKKYLFQKFNHDQWLFYDVKYDFSSAGHFHYHKHSVNGRATIMPKPQYNGFSMGENIGFTVSDIAKLRMLYNFIVRKKENKAPECERLFMPGPNFRNRKPNLPHKKPRKKPRQYLGRLKEHAETDSQAKSNSDDRTEESNDDYTHEKGDTGKQIKVEAEIEKLGFSILQDMTPEVKKKVLEELMNVIPEITKGIPILENATQHLPNVLQFLSKEDIVNELFISNKNNKMIEEIIKLIPNVSKWIPKLPNMMLYLQNLSQNPAKKDTFEKMKKMSKVIVQLEEEKMKKRPKLQLPINKPDLLDPSITSMEDEKLFIPFLVPIVISEIIDYTVKGMVKDVKKIWKHKKY